MKLVKHYSSIYYWTYRGDLELQKLAKRGIHKESQLDCLGYILKKFQNRFLEVKIFDNAKEIDEQLLIEIQDGNVVVPSCDERKLKMQEWIKKL